ncbi:MAG: hypothetical protein MN733_20690 [Nitrososphaera sp.]|nr:hypothetical protein [Nitrososphaera sp.]
MIVRISSWHKAHINYNASMKHIDPITDHFRLVPEQKAALRSGVNQVSSTTVAQYNIRIVSENDRLAVNRDGFDPSYIVFFRVVDDN